MTEELEPGFELLPGGGEPRPRRRTRLLATGAAAVVLAGGGVATYAAFAGSDQGANSPQAAVAKVIDDLNHSDLLGLVNDLAPGERDALRPAMTKDIAALKRLGVLSSKADPSSVGGVSFSVRGLKYGSPVKINDNVQIVRITGGTMTASASLAKLPLTARLLDLAKNAKSSTSTHTISASDPVRVAAQKVGGRWYASIFYSVADEAADHKVPTAADRIPARGATSAKAAVRTMITDLTGGKVRNALELISPAELGALHDYGGMLADKAHASRLPLDIATLDLATKAVDGGTEVSVTKLVAIVQGQRLSATVSGGCVKVVSPLFSKKVCGSDIADMIGSVISLGSCMSGYSHGYVPLSSVPSKPYSSRLHITRDHAGFGSCSAKPVFSKAQKTALTHLFSGLLGTGLVTQQVNGSWYVAPVRTLTNLTTSVLSSLKGDDLFALLSLRSLRR